MEGESSALPELQIKKWLRTAAGWHGISRSSPPLPFSPFHSPDSQLCQFCIMDPLNLLCRQGVNGAQTCLGTCNCTEIFVCVREGEMGQGLASHMVWSQEMQACQICYTHTYTPTI